MSREIFPFVLLLFASLVLASGYAFAATTFSATFDFDTGTPALYVRQPTPFNQTVNNATANFTSPPDLPLNPGFSVQNLESLATIATVINSTKFSGLFLWPSTTNRENLTINFNTNLISITLDFKTVEYHDPGPGGTGSPISIAAYAGSPLTLVGSPVTAYGVETPLDVYPEGTLTFNSTAQPFKSVTIYLPSIPQGATGFILDNITVGGTDTIPEFSSILMIFLLMFMAITTVSVGSKRLRTK